MDRERVSSSNITSIGYDSSTQTLEIEFHEGEVYQYYGVPENIHDELMSASSHGIYHNVNIRKSYSYTRVQ